VAVPLKLEGEAIYAASKAAVISLTQILAHEFAKFGITVNAIGPTPIKTDLLRGIPPEKLERLISRQAIKRYGGTRDVIQVIDFFIDPASDFVTGQVIFLGGIWCSWTFFLMYFGRLPALRLSSGEVKVFHTASSWLEPIIGAVICQRMMLLLDWLH